MILSCSERAAGRSVAPKPSARTAPLPSGCVLAAVPRPLRGVGRVKALSSARHKAFG
jgi:hypothetical protein